MSHDEDARPIERSARKKPTSASSDTLAAPRRHRAVDPRFDPMYGSMDKKQFNNNYKFLEDQREIEQTTRLARIKRLHMIVRRHRLEAAAAESGEDLGEEFNLTEDEQEVFLEGIDERDAIARTAALRELATLRRTPVSQIEDEVAQLKRQSSLYRSNVGDVKAKDRANLVKKRIMKEEVASVKKGEKQSPYFLKKSELKKRVMENRFDELNERGGKLAVDKYVGRKNRTPKK
ncbi:Hypothetical protein, putative [Bodo saltans]|uniref:rRNA biogenesis protein RRP36 n=1 Tax=Bodo saltans TaxID=75058 RepID=A0A0S4IME8_BODSA|nr:Hypothetical protein, putative [Bodo saltans]|eukprot:CUE72829.1 Hypothetical protein, putative [Bodo saltans]